MHDGPSLIDDPLTDPRGTALLSARPAAIDQIAATLRQVAQLAQECADGLQRAQSDLTWDGPAANSFRAAYARAPAELDVVAAACARAALTVQSYGDALSPLQSRFAAVSAQLGAGRASTDSLRERLQELRTALATLNLRAPGADDALQRDYDLTLSGLKGLWESNSELERRATAILSSFETERVTVAAALDTTAALAPRQTPSATGLDAFAGDPNWVTYQSALSELAALVTLAIAPDSGSAELTPAQRAGLLSTVGG